MSTQGETLKIVLTHALNFANFHMSIDSADTFKEEFTIEQFGEMTFDIVEQPKNDNVLIIMVNNVNITQAINIKNDMTFNLKFSFYIDNSVITTINIEVTDLVYNAIESDSIFINDFLNGYIKFVFSGISNTYIDFDELSTNAADEKIIFNESLDINYILDKQNNIELSAKALFINDLDVTYDISINEGLMEKVSKYSTELNEYIQKLIDNNGVTVNNLYEFDDGIVDVNTQALSTDYGDFLSKVPTTTSELMKHLILNAAIRSGVISLSNCLALFDGTEDFTLNKISYSTTFTKKL